MIATNRRHLLRCVTDHRAPGCHATLAADAAVAPAGFTATNNRSPVDIRAEDKRSAARLGRPVAERMPSGSRTLTFYRWRLLTIV